jgi:hypothetical protein
MRRASLLLVAAVAVGLGGCGGLPSKLEVGHDYRVADLSLHGGYSSVSYLEIGSEWWVFYGDGSGDSIFVDGVLRRLSDERAVLVVDGVAHPLARVPEHGDAYCL